MTHAKKSNGFYDVVISGKRIFNRQDAPKVYDLNTVAFVSKPKFILNCKSIFDGKVDINLVEKKRSLDLDFFAKKITFFPLFFLFFHVFFLKII